MSLKGNILILDVETTGLSVDDQVLWTSGLKI